MTRRVQLFMGVVVLTGLLASCDGFLTPEADLSLEDDELTILRVAEDAPPLLATEKSFWIVRGEEREIELRYASSAGYNGKCLRLVVPAEAPLRHADGRNVEPGDSIKVTVRVLDPKLFLFEFDPQGALLNPAFPAVLQIRYRWSAQDLNGDGKVDAEDERIAGNFGVWRSDAGGRRWTNVPSTRQSDIQEIEAPLVVFTRYALASD